VVEDIFTSLQAQKIEEAKDEQMVADSMPSAQVKSVFMIDPSKLKKANNQV